MVLINIIVSILGTYGISTLIADYDGIDDILRKLRAKRLHRAINGVFDCNVCMSVYFGVLFAAGLNIGLAGYFATIGGVIILSRNL